MEAEDQIITFETYYDPMLAQIVRTRLEDNDIPCFVADENLGTLYPVYNSAIGGIKLKIFARDLERCKAILAQDESLPADETEAETAEGMLCPNCGSADVRSNLTAKKLSWLGTIAALMSDEKPWHCNNCGKNFE
jgi:predicted RNA-binding Zn-ribbon protein involved in translation (DUF1610 family)